MVSLIYELKAVNITLVAQTRHQPASRPTQQTVQVFNTTVLQNETFFSNKGLFETVLCEQSVPTFS